MHENCHRHHTELAEARCKECAYGHCTDCLVYVGGPDSEPYCITCALAVAGIRGSRKPKRSRRERRALKRNPVHAPVAAMSTPEAEAAAFDAGAFRTAFDDLPAPPEPEPAPAPASNPDLTPAWASLDERHWNLSAG